MAGMSSLTFNFTVSAGINAQNNLTGTDYAPNSNPTTITKKVSVGTAAADAAVGGADEVYSAITSIAASGSANIDLTNFTDLLSTAAVSLARGKILMIRLLSATDDTVNGTAANFVTVGNNTANDWISTGGSGWFNTNTSKIDIPNGGLIAFATPSAGGVVANSTNKIIHVANGDASLAAKVQITIAGGTA